MNSEFENFASKKCCESNLKLLEDCGSEVLENIATEDETFLTFFVSECQRESAEWRLLHEFSARKLRCGSVNGYDFILSVF